MPTVPPVPAPDSPESKQAATSFGTDAERYDRTRPRYPRAVVDRVTGASSGPLDVLDVGCGTGIVARRFQAAGHRVLGVDPDARMAAVARRRGTAVEVATLADWDPAGRTYDAVVAGQTWHWIDPVAGAAKAARVLRPGGRLAVFWNASRLPAGLAEAFAEVYRRTVPDSPFDLAAAATQGADGYQALCDRAADGIREAGGFEAAGQWRDDWEWTCTKDAWLDMVPTQGAFTRLPAERLAPVLAGLGEAIDAAGGTFTIRYATQTVTAVRADGAQVRRAQPPPL
ncbi:class I SAM-dependent methyltransferase [Streptomyces sp. NPDC051940]|uniref:class I SAM-dependent methyltransferase n=1 Tax=Streptomyces sp. NPDC051940 TaxID=3155675 RepID=UPI003425672B